MAINVKSAVMAGAIGAAAAVVLIVINGLNFTLQDVLLGALDMGWSLRSDISSISSSLMLPIDVVVALAVGLLVVWLCRPGSFRSAVMDASAAGLVLGVMIFFANAGYLIILRPIISGYGMSLLTIVLTLLSSFTYAVMLAGLAIAGGTLCATFLVKLQQA